MINTELQLMKAILKEDKEEAINKYNLYLIQIPNMNLARNSELREWKNAMISLLSLLYRNSCNSSICHKLLYQKRNEFIRQVEETSSVDELKELGLIAVKFHLLITKDSVFITRNPIINEALSYVHTNLEKNISLKSVAARIHVSCSYLSFLFSKLLGYSFSDYVNKLRIERSKVLLRNTNMTMTEIAIECGFNSQSYFCYVFKRFESITPKKYRSTDKVILKTDKVLLKKEAF